MNVVSSSPRRQSEDIALHWVSRLAAEPDNTDLDESRLPAAEQQRLRQWLASDAAHAEAYAQARQLWQITGPVAAQLAQEDDAALQAILRQSKPRSRRWPVPVAMAASLLLASLLALFWRPEQWLDDLRADYRSAPGQLSRITLADGSDVLLDADSAIQVDLSEQTRSIRLLRGAAFFHVKHNGQPFVVRAHGGETQVLGTRFEVRNEPQGAQVTVEEGKVAVRAQPDSEPQLLTAAQRTDYRQGQAGSLQNVAMPEALSWREGRLSFRRQPLSEALQVVQRYSQERIVLLDASLGTRPVSGDFASNDPQAMLTAFQAVLGYSMLRLPGGTVVIR
ncbi:FecR family protein [Pseudomonas sp. 3A(2025)]